MNRALRGVYDVIPLNLHRCADAALPSERVAGSGCLRMHPEGTA